MQSNRESAKRSRMRKQKLLDDLMGQVSDLRKENEQILNCINITTQHFLNVEAENSILRAQMAELSHRLQSLNDIINSINTSSGIYDMDGFLETAENNFMNAPMSMSMLYVNQAIMANADNFQW